MVSSSTNSIEDFIQKFTQKGLKENPLDVLLKLLIKEEELPSLRKDFKEKYLKPLLKNWESLSKNIDKNSSETNNLFSNLKDVIDSKINELKKDNKESNKLDSNKKETQSSNFFGLEFLRNIYKKDTQPQVKEPIQEDTQPQVKEPTQKQQEQPQEIKEKLIQQKPQETIISFSTQTSDFLSKLTNNLIDKQKENIEGLELKGNAPSGGGIMDFISGLIRSFPLLLAAIGGATVLAGMFWPEIKKFISEKFGDKAADFFDKFQGTINAIGKFFTMGGLQLKFGNIFKNVGELLGKLGDDLIMSFKGLFTGLADEGAGGLIKGFGAAVKAGGLKGILKGAAGAILKGVSKVTLKAIPLIGSVISFADAYGRFKEGEILQGTIDIAAGLAGLVPGYGTAFSIGLSLLNAFIDFKSGEEKEQIKTQAVSISSMLLKGVGFLSKTLGKGVLKRLPLIGTMLTLASAWEKFQQGEILGGTLDVASGIVSLIPGLGIPLSIGIDLLNSFISTPENKENGVQRTGFSIATIAMKALGYFAKFGKPFFKRLPLIGTLLSFGSAWDRFKENNIVGGLLDVVSGVASLVPGVGTAISIGVDILNSFLDSKDPETGKPKSVAVGNFFKGIWEKFKTTGVFKAFSELSSGLVKLVTGDYKEGIKDLSKLPYIGGMFSPISDWLNGKEEQQIETVNSGKIPLSQTSKEIIKNLPTEYKKEEEDEHIKTQDSLVNETKTIDEEILKIKEKTPKGRGDASSNNQKIQELEKQKQELLEKQKELEYKTKRFKELKEGSKLTTLEDYEAVEETQKNANFYSNDPVLSQISGMQNTKSGVNFEPRKDVKNSGNIIIDPKTGNVITLHANDSIFASKPGDSVDQTFKKLNESIDNLNKRIENLVRIQVDSQKNVNQQDSKSNVIINNNTTQTQSQPKNIKFSGERDEIYLTRIDWLRNNSYAR
jgi:hypothetical protein